RVADDGHSLKAAWSRDSPMRRRQRSRHSKKLECMDGWKRFRLQDTFAGDRNRIRTGNVLRLMRTCARYPDWFRRRNLIATAPGSHRKRPSDGCAKAGLQTMPPNWRAE